MQVVVNFKNLCALVISFHQSRIRHSAIVLGNKLFEEKGKIIRINVKQIDTRELLKRYPSPRKLTSGRKLGSGYLQQPANGGIVTGSWQGNIHRK